MKNILSSTSADNDLVILPNGCTMSVAEYHEMICNEDEGWRDRMRESLE